MTAPPRDTRSVGRRCQCASFGTLTIKPCRRLVSRFTRINLSRHSPFPDCAGIALGYALREPVDWPLKIAGS
jgi:hypothetical protein